MASTSIFVIGAGVAGLACAKVLAEAGYPVRVADKGRGPGGRCSTRRSAVGPFDHGAAYFTARDEDFVRQVETWQRAGVVAPWEPRLGPDVRRTDDLFYVGAPSMNAFIRHEAERMEAEFGLEIGVPMEGRDGRFDLLTKSGHAVADADFLVLAVPAPQAAILLPEDSFLRKEAEQAGLAPCWTLMAGFDDAAIEPSYDYNTPQADELDAVIWQSGRPGRKAGARVVAHASASWSQAHLENDPDDVSDMLLRALMNEIGSTVRPTHLAVHRWRYARVTEPAQDDFGLDLEHGVATCGDWHIAPRVESAWVSGHRLGKALLSAL
jgi:predicted NAD/FAD-dependent oxidoreductase